MPTIRENPTEYRADSVPLLDLYKIALDEYRFEVKLNADRTIQYLTLSAIVLSAGVGLLRVGTPGRSTTFFVALIFLCGVFIALLGVMAVRRGHEHYRRTVYKKTLIENLLGLHNPVQNYSGATLAVTTTRGQGEVHEMLHNPDAWLQKSTPLGTITRTAVLIFILFGVADSAGIAVLIYQYLH